MLTYIYLDVGECSSCMSKQRFKLQISFNYGNIEQNAFS